jgi:transcriptional regulator with XRE-family HTH domain
MDRARAQATDEPIDPFAAMFGKHVRGLRKARRMTQERLAEISGLSGDTIRRLEHGSFSPSLSTLNKISRGLALSLGTMFDSFQLCEVEPMREILDLLRTRTPREVTLAIRVLRALFDSLDAGEHPCPNEGG